MRLRAKLDDNQKEIVKALRAVGCAVQSLAPIGKGVPDLLCAFRGNWYLAEIKDGQKVPSKQRLTPDEQKWHEEFGLKAPVHTWTCVDDALKAIGATSI